MNRSRATILQTDALLFSELFHEGRFTVPWHQRHYDWDQRHVLELLHDLEEAVREGRRCYFLGAIMLVPIDEHHWEINDGQQRMITISLICAALCRRFSQETRDSQREAQALRMLFNLDASGVWSMNEAEQYEPRVAPPLTDQMRYKQIIRGNSIGTNGKLTIAWNTIENFLGLTNPGNRWERYFDFLREKLEVACLEVPRDLDPNAIYETINSRGKQLDDLDRIRNFIYSHFNAAAETQRRISVHANLERVGESFRSSSKATEYLRCRLQCRYGFLRSDNFYRDVRQAIREQRARGSRPQIAPADYAFELTREVTSPEDIGLYRTLTASNPDPEILHAFESASRTVNSPRNVGVFLSELNGYGVTRPLVFALMSRYVRETDGRRKRSMARKVNRCLHRLATFVMRTAFVAPKFESSHFETEFSNFAKETASSDNLDQDKFSRFLRECDRASHGILNDTRFEDIMAQTTMTGHAKVKKFLLGVNRYQRPDAVVLNEAQCSVEHILPVSSAHHARWSGFQKVDADDWTRRLGNLTLMSRADNRPGSTFNSDFARKREIYRSSSVALTRALEQYDEWTPNAIEQRQRAMANAAIHVWTFE